MASNPMKKLIVFDLDGTLAESKSCLEAEMSALLSALLGISCLDSARPNKPGEEQSR